MPIGDEEEDINIGGNKNKAELYVLYNEAVFVDNIDIPCGFVLSSLFFVFYILKKDSPPTPPCLLV